MLLTTSAVRYNRDFPTLLVTPFSHATGVDACRIAQFAQYSINACFFLQLNFLLSFICRTSRYGLDLITSSELTVTVNKAE